MSIYTKWKIPKEVSDLMKPYLTQEHFVEYFINANELGFCLEYPEDGKITDKNEWEELVLERVRILINAWRKSNANSD